MYDNDFDGVFKFTNVTDEDFVYFWNNREYIFPAKATCPMIIANETLENIQEIRKKAAYKLAMREFYKSKNYKNLVAMGKKAAGGMPPIPDDKILEPMIESCLKPLPMAKAKVKEGKKESDRNYKASKAISDKDNPNFVFREESENVRSIGAMPDKVL